MAKEERKDVKMNMQQYEILKDFAESRGITLGEAIQEMQKDIDLLKAHELNTISENALMFCDQVEALADCGRLPSWLKDAIKATIRPIVLRGMVGNQPIDFEGLRSVWTVPSGMRLITCFDKD
jgi:hypothetical protein